MTLEDALVVWARTPHPLVANSIDALSEKALKTFAAPKAKTKEAFHAAWLERAVNADAVTIGWLAKTLREKLEVRSGRGGGAGRDYARIKYAVWFERLEAIAPYTNDPRVGVALCEVFEVMPFGVAMLESTLPVYAPLADILAGSADARLAPRLRAACDASTVSSTLMRDVARELLPSVVEALERLVIPSLEEEPRWRALGEGEVQREAQAGVHEPKLLEHTLENPSDDSARIVYADALLERGEARGEFIALQLDGSPAALKRANALLKKHRESWLGPLHFVLRNVVFERGFLVEAELERNAAARPELWSEAAHDTRLTTVRRLHKGRGNVEHLYEFYRGGALHSLELFEAPTQDAFELAPTFKNTLREVVLSERCSCDRAEDLAELPHFEAMRTAGHPGRLKQWIQALDRHRLFSRLKRLHFEPTFARVRYIDPFCDPRVWGGALERFQLKNIGELRKTSGGFEFDFSAYCANEGLIVLQQLEGTFAQVRCAFSDKLPVELAQTLEAAATARGVNIELIESLPA